MSPESRSPSTPTAARRTAVIWHDRYGWYMPGLGAAFVPAGGLVQPFEPVDSPASKTRLKTLIEVSGLSGDATMLRPEPAGEEEVLAFHDRDYVEMLKGLEAAGGGDAGPAAPTGPDAYATALLSAGGCLLAVDEVMSGRHDNAYALVRPPGHHARRGEGAGSCILANAVLAALRARREHGVERIAIVDWDVHHGNSMQEAFWEDPDVITVSVHQEGYFPPASGAVEETGGSGAPGSNLNVPLPPGTGHDAHVEVAERIIGPALADHRPDLVLACTGYDGSAMDPMGRMLCHSDTYRVLARTAIAVADEHCDGRIAMIQEGGVSPAYTPFCGVAVLEELLGVRRCEDPFLETFANVPGHAITAEQRRAIDAADPSTRGL